MLNNSGASTSSQKLSAANADDSSTGDGEDVGWWDCSLCTYKNSNDKFKCEICDLRRGTSTRKPRCSADTIVAMVVKQQEQIRQQTKVKTPKIRSSLPADTATSSIDSSFRPKSTKSKSSNSKSRKARIDFGDGHTEDDSDSCSPKPKKKKSAETKNSRKHSAKGSAKNHQNDQLSGVTYDDDDTTDADHTDVSDESSRVSSPSVSKSSSDDQESIVSYSSSSADSPEPTNSSPIPQTRCSENPFKVTPIEVNGNLIKYSPPTSSGRTGLIIDKKRFSQHSVTVNDVTITFTEFATRQNKYVRKKKKKRRDFSRPKTNNGNGKSRPSTTKDEFKSNSNNDSANAEQDP